MNPDVNPTPVQRIRRVLGDQVVVIWVARGTKAHLIKAPGPRTLRRIAPILSAPPPSGENFPPSVWKSKGKFA